MTQEPSNNKIIQEIANVNFERFEDASSLRQHFEQVARTVPYENLVEAVGQLAEAIAEGRQKLMEAYQKSVVDPLTGVLNYEGLREGISGRIADIRRHTNEVHYLAFIDLDGFKDINDNFGHEAGDNILRDIAARLRKSTRYSDVVGRQGGDEFCMILQEGDDVSLDVDIVRNKIRQAIEGVHCQKGGVIYPVGVSIGVVRMDADSISHYPTSMTLGSIADVILSLADKGMYIDKWGPSGRKPDGYGTSACLYVPPKNMRLNELQEKIRKEIPGVLPSQNGAAYQVPDIS
ncbi:MAG: GGDEF domain-containing protein [Alphaproteobacteria bacterium]|nr:GGDEF domain-containing protein [Alphaproteobacteria bacterium]